MTPPNLDPTPSLYHAIVTVIQHQGGFAVATVLLGGGLIFMYLRVFRPDMKQESEQRSKRTENELLKAVEETKQREIERELVRVQRDILDKASHLMTRFENNLVRHEEHLKTIKQKSN